MSNDYLRIELITGYLAAGAHQQKLQIIAQSFGSGETVSSTARRHSVLLTFVKTLKRDYIRISRGRTPKRRFGSPTDGLRPQGS